MSYTEATPKNTIRNSVSVLYLHTPHIPESLTMLNEALQTIRMKTLPHFLTHGMLMIRYGNQIHHIKLLCSCSLQVFQPDDSLCVVCNMGLGKSIPLPGGRGNSWFLYAIGIQPVTTKLRICENKQSGARHSIRDWRSGGEICLLNYCI